MTQSIPHPPPPPSTHAGYLSEEDKRKFITTAVIVTVAFVLLQILIPMIAVFSMMPVFFSSAFNMAEYDLEKAVVHDGNLFFFAKHVNQGRRTRAGGNFSRPRGIMKFNLENIPDKEFAPSENPFAEIFGSPDEENNAPEEIGRVEAEYPWFLAGGENLLVLSRRKMWKVEGTNLIEVPEYKRQAAASRPFYYENLPATIEGNPRGYFLSTLENGQWNRRRIFLETVKNYKLVRRYVQVVPIEGVNHLFVEMNEMLLHRVGIPAESSRDGDKEWESVGSTEHRWLAFAFGDKPAVLRDNHTTLEISIFENGEWSTMSHISLKEGSLARSFYPVATGESLRLAATGFPGTLMFYSVEDDKLVLNAQFGSGFPFPKNFMRTMLIINLVSLPLPIVLAVILSGLMLKHRVTTHWHEGRTAQYASLSRRAFAQVADGLIAFLGMLPLYMSFFSMFKSFGTGTISPMIFPAKFFLNSAFAFLWMFFLLIAFSLGESRWGATPGKWALGIRVVGTDLAPCGIWRAILRNVLKIIDSYFGFLVGILTVTFTKKWQRLGDMAARTIVIRKTDA
jgi:uncharacterized RDD family membrane protein YckC